MVLPAVLVAVISISCRPAVVGVPTIAPFTLIGLNGGAPLTSVTVTKPSRGSFSSLRAKSTNDGAGSTPTTSLARVMAAMVAASAPVPQPTSRIGPESRSWAKPA